MDLELLSCASTYDRSIRLSHFTQTAWLDREIDPDILERAEQARRKLRALGALVLHPAHPLYPKPFLELESPPLHVSCLGEGLASLERPLTTCVAVVGSREPSGRALDWIDLHLPRFLKSTRAVIVSGGARGIDQRAHAASLRAGLPTLAFLPSGLARPYPNEMMRWESEIGNAGGALISVHAPETEIRRSHFEARNRLIVALSAFVLVVEARRRSGSVMTARLATELGRTVYVLPSFPGETSGAGSLDLLCDGAPPIRDADDLATALELHRASRVNESKIFRVGISDETTGLDVNPTRERPN